MQNQNKIFIIIILSVLIFVPFLVNARSGCCSHHGGVCGCGCCDGTPLSATCAPYYPQCNSDSGYTAGNNSKDTASTNDNSSTWWILGILGAGGVGIYYYNKNKNKK
ncbi:MAG: hypothetical protein ABSA74_01975 [Candidatus Staskawiczbacteria bacterium]